ncbi:MAG: bifunctional (p)ppGpp synthetase/guanosine-3',5'-bis(diphosphate) 3'-pyrophosphohydrolase [Candidatus Kapabacteria bacterium]|nr:bifunctional (p)ppGpp synthetase/guanosine-3',5'-bis(diphosphate) 3'-pyrophosphohydrolase [Candidatus Kapabacteria bacterium]
MFANDQPSYNASFLSLEEVEARIVHRCDPLDVTRVTAAYEMAKSVHEHQLRNDGTPYVYHATRVARILMDELGLFDADLLIAALLQDVLEDSTTITRTVLEYNFGSYVAYLVDTLTKDLAKAKQDPDGVDIAHAEGLRAASEDAMLIKLASRLDNFRCLSFNVKRNPLVYIRNTFERYLPIADASANALLHRLADEIRKESNKFLG